MSESAVSTAALSVGLLLMFVCWSFNFCGSFCRALLCISLTCKLWFHNCIAKLRCRMSTYWKFAKFLMLACLKLVLNVVAKGADWSLPNCKFQLHADDLPVLQTVTQASDKHQYG